ncbi:toprim domain-containing protein [Fructobacillus tropaeoli]|uniref:PcfD protein n=1 Tax=Fructobacillus tropaeoli TaxID=709323 RepID=A0A3F3H4W5_9LACO|nr:toprim domain-containing protein [Fructobacillus tropaeoli]GAP04817.1 PcfD protein [Fructobacillus tropaeoli]
MNFKERSALIERAKTMSIIDVAKQLGMELEKTGRSYQWTEHDSLVLVPDKNNFYWNSRSDGGDALKLVQMVRDVGFIEATEILGAMEGIPSDQANQAVAPRAPFAYKLKEHKVMNAGEKYLTEERGLTQETIDFFREQGVLAQASYTTDFEKKKSEPVLVFKGLSNGEVAGVSLQGVWKNEAYGKREHLKCNLGDGYAGFRVAVGSPSKNPKEQPLKVKAFESPIDLMSYYQLHQAELEDTLLVSTNGLKKGAISYAVADWLNPSMANEQKSRLLDFLNDKQTYEKGAIKVDLAVDNDQAGHNFTEKIGWSNLTVTAEYPQGTAGQAIKDWNDVVKLAKQDKNPKSLDSEALITDEYLESKGFNKSTLEGSVNSLFETAFEDDDYIVLLNEHLDLDRLYRDVRAEFVKRLPEEPDFNMDVYTDELFADSAAVITNHYVNLPAEELLQSKTKVSNEPMTRETNKELFTDYQQAFTDVQSYTKTEQAKWLLKLAKQPMNPVVYEDFLYPEGMVPENWPVQAGVPFDEAANQQQAILKAIDVTAHTMADPEFVQGLELGNSPHPATASEVYQEPSQLFDDNGNLYDDEMAMGDLLNDMKDYLNPPVELTTQEAAILSAVDPRLISNAHQETVSPEKVAERQNDSAMNPQSRKALKSMKKSIVNDGALSIGYFQGVKAKMLELDPDILKKTMASAGGWVAETLTTNADLAMADKPNEFDNVLVTEMVRNLNYQDFKEVAPFFFNYQVSQEDILATPMEASPRNKMAIENGGLTDHIRFELPDSLIQANEGLEQGEKNILAYNPLTDDILAMEGGRPDLFIMNSQWEEKASIELSASDLLDRAQIGIQDKAFQLLEQYGEKQYANDFISMSEALQLEHSDLTFSDDEMKAALQEVDRNKAFDDLIDCKKAQQKVTRKRGLKM